MPRSSYLQFLIAVCVRAPRCCVPVTVSRPGGVSPSRCVSRVFVCVCVPRRRRCVTVCHGVPRRCVVPVCGCGCGSPAGTATHWQLGVGGTGRNLSEAPGPAGRGLRGGEPGRHGAAAGSGEPAPANHESLSFLGRGFCQRCFLSCPILSTLVRYQRVSAVFKFLNFWFFFESRL